MASSSSRIWWAGTYHLAAHTDVVPGEWNGPRFLEQLFAGAITLTLAEGEKSKIFGSDREPRGRTLFQGVLRGSNSYFGRIDVLLAIHFSRKIDKSA